ncbi:MAG: M48 family metallopeptidase, partial [Bacteroidales bacterium]
RVDELATKYGFRYGSVYVKNAKTRWGSCSAKNNINLNLHLMRIPTHLRDYVILHELVHTVHKNHGQEYWALLDCITGEARLFEKELKKHSIELV